MGTPRPSAKMPLDSTGEDESLVQRHSSSVAALDAWSSQLSQQRHTHTEPHAELGMLSEGGAETWHDETAETVSLGALEHRLNAQIGQAILDQNVELQSYINERMSTILNQVADSHTTLLGAISKQNHQQAQESPTVAGEAVARASYV